MVFGNLFRKLLGVEDIEIPEPTSTCVTCGLEFPESSMVMTDTASYCDECNNQRKKELSDMEFKKKQAAILQKVKYHCYSCKFNFSRKQDFTIRLCPNCGSENFVEHDKIV